MLDLETIFDPDRKPRSSILAASDPEAPATPAPEIRVEDLDPEWRVEWEERAAIMEYDGGLPRERAEAAALSYIIDRLNRGERFAAGCNCPTCRCRNDA
jgi:hypothetical protein